MDNVPLRLKQWYRERGTERIVVVTGIFGLSNEVRVRTLFPKGGRETRIQLDKFEHRFEFWGRERWCEARPGSAGYIVAESEVGCPCDTCVRNQIRRSQRCLDGRRCQGHAKAQRMIEDAYKEETA